MSIKVGEVGKLFIYATYFDMSAYTSVELTLTSPSGDEAVVDNSRISVPAVAYNDPDLGVLAASTYMTFDTEATDFVEAGEYSVYGTYNDATPRTLYGDCAKFDIYPVNCYTPEEEEAVVTCGCTHKRSCRCGGCS